MIGNNWVFIRTYVTEHSEDIPVEVSSGKPGYTFLCKECKFYHDFPDIKKRVCEQEISGQTVKLLQRVEYRDQSQIVHEKCPHYREHFSLLPTEEKVLCLFGER